MRLWTVFRTTLNWSFLGVIIALVVFYWTQLRDRFDLKITVEDEVNLVEVRERIPDLRILYMDEDLLSSGQQIRLLTLTLRNDGKTILQHSYDANQPFGMQFADSKILGIGEIRSNSDYLRTNILSTEKRGSVQLPLDRQDKTASNNEIHGRGELHLEKVIIEAGKFCTVQLYLLQPASDEPTRIHPFGKIANIESIPVLYRKESEASSRARPSEVLLTIGLAYLGLFGVTFGPLYLLGAVQKRKKNQRLKRFLAQHPRLNDEEKRIVNIYRREWSAKLSKLMRMLLKGKDVVDLGDFVSTNLYRSSFFPLDRLVGPRNKVRLLALPPEILSRRDAQIGLAEKNRAFVKEFFKDVLALGPKDHAAPADTNSVAD